MQRKEPVLCDMNTTCFPCIETTSLVTDLVARQPPGAIGVSGGKDHDGAAFEITTSAQAGGHRGPVILIPEQPGAGRA